MGRPRTIDDHSILRAARDLFLREGHAAATRDIARAAGVSQAVLYQRFGTKDELFLTAMLPEPPDVDALLGPRAEAEALGARGHVLAITHRLLAWFSAVMPAFLHLATWPGAGPLVLERVHERFFASGLLDRLVARIEQLQSSGLVAPRDAQAAAELLLSAAHSLGVMAAAARIPLEGPDAEARIDRLVDVIWLGLTPQVPGGAEPGRAPLDA